VRRIDPRISDEVRWYLKTRGIPFPDCPPKIKTPEPVEVDGAKFDPARVDHVLRVFSHLRHTQGEWAGRPLKPDPWQVAYFFAPVFGWVREDERGQLARIVRRATQDVPRKNGKTTTAGGVAIYLTTADDEPGAQVYALAAGKDQARFCYDPVKALAEQAPALKPHVKALANRIVHLRTASYFAVVSSVADLMHGANVHGAIIDELHVHKKPDLVHAIESGTGSRRQPLIITITTADDGRPETIYAKRRERLEDLAAGVLVDPSVYGVIWAADEDDDPFVESTWRKANPGYGISPTKAFMEAAALEAQQSPTDQAKFLRLHLGIRTTMQTKYLSPDEWAACTSPADPESLRGHEVYGGLDLSSTTDLAGLALCFPESDETCRFLWHYWAPREGIEERERRDRVPYRHWVKQGLITLTDGAVTDYDVIREALGQTRGRFPRLKQIGYDPWNATQLVNNLTADGFDMVKVPQTLTYLTDPTKELQRRVLSRAVRHDGDPVTKWMANNVAVRTDVNGNIRPDKEHSTDRIDGIVAAIMALDQVIRHETKGNGFLDYMREKRAEVAE